MEVSSSEQGVYPLLSKPVQVGETRQWGKLLTGHRKSDILCSVHVDS